MCAVCISVDGACGQVRPVSVRVSGREGREPGSFPSRYLICTFVCCFVCCSVTDISVFVAVGLLYAQDRARYTLPRDAATARHTNNTDARRRCITDRRTYTASTDTRSGHIGSLDPQRRVVVGRRALRDTTLFDFTAPSTTAAAAAAATTTAGAGSDDNGVGGGVSASARPRTPVLPEDSDTQSDSDSNADSETQQQHGDVFDGAEEDQVADEDEDESADVDGDGRDRRDPVADPIEDSDGDTMDMS